jgi:hypothetical protein
VFLARGIVGRCVFIRKARVADDLDYSHIGSLVVLRHVSTFRIELVPVFGLNV